MADPSDATKVGSFTTTLSLAVEVTDAVTGGRPAGSPEVSLAGVDAEPVVNRSGYHLFFDLEADAVTVRVDGGERYADAERADVPTFDPGPGFDATDPADLPVETVELRPTPAYEFPAAATVVRGTVRDAGGAPVAGATVTVEGVDRTTTSTDAGEYVLFFARPFDDGVGVSDGSVRVDGSNPTVTASHGVYGTTSATFAVPEGSLTSRDLAF